MGEAGTRALYSKGAHCFDPSGRAALRSVYSTPLHADELRKFVLSSWGKTADNAWGIPVHRSQPSLLQCQASRGRNEEMSGLHGNGQDSN